MNIQMIGIDEFIFQGATDEARISWAKQNTTAGFGLCEGAIAWLQEHQDSVGVAFFAGQSTFPCNDLAEKDEYVYRLASDCQPPVNRWVFNPETLAVDWTHDKTIKHGWLEVSEDFAQYVQNKPDGEWELRIPNGEDDYISYGASDVPPHRWCKPRKPRYAAGNYSGINYVWDHKGRYAVCHGGQMQDMHRIAKAMNAMDKSREAK